MKTKLTLVLTGLFLLQVGKALALEPLTVEIDNTGQYQGQLHLALYHFQPALDTQLTWQEAEPYAQVSQQLDGDNMSITLSDVPLGQYAIRLYVDENNNQQLDRSMLGIPKEAVGFSNNPSLTLGEPSMDDVQFNYTEAHSQVQIRLIKNVSKRAKRKFQ